MRKSWIFSGIHIIQPLLIDKVTILAHSTDMQSFIMTKNKKSLLRNRKKILKKKVFTEISLWKKLLRLKTLQKLIRKTPRCPVLQFCHWSQNAQIDSRVLKLPYRRIQVVIPVDKFTKDISLLLYSYQMFSWGKDETIVCFLLLVEISVFVEFDVIVWHCWLFIQIVVTQGLLSTHIVEVELYSTVLLIAFEGRLFPKSAVKVKTITIVLLQ